MADILARLPALLIAIALTLAGKAVAAEPEIPILWDAKERLAKPDLSQRPRLRFLTTTDFPPFNFLDANGHLTGFHIDLARAVCAELAIAEKCQIQTMPWEKLDAALEAGEGEAIIAGTAITAEARRRLGFSRPYLRFPARFVMPKAKAVAEPIYERLTDKRVGVIAGSAHERLLRDYFGTVKVVTYTRQDWLFGDLKSGNIDAAFGDGMRYGFWLAGSDAADCCRFAGGPYLAPEYLGSGLAIASKRDDPALTAAFDYALHEISAKGTFAELYLRYFPVSFF